MTTRTTTICRHRRRLPRQRRCHRRERHGGHHRAPSGPSSHAPPPPPRRRRGAPKTPRAPHRTLRSAQASSPDGGRTRSAHCRRPSPRHCWRRTWRRMMRWRRTASLRRKLPAGTAWLRTKLLAGTTAWLRMKLLGWSASARLERLLAGAALARHASTRAVIRIAARRSPAVRRAAGAVQCDRRLRRSHRQPPPAAAVAAAALARRRRPLRVRTAEDRCPRPEV